MKGRETCFPEIKALSLTFEDQISAGRGREKGTLNCGKAQSRGSITKILSKFSAVRTAYEVGDQ